MPCLLAALASQVRSAVHGLPSSGSLCLRQLSHLLVHPMECPPACLPCPCCLRQARGPPDLPLPHLPPANGSPLVADTPLHPWCRTGVQPPFGRLRHPRYSTRGSNGARSCPPLPSLAPQAMLPARAAHRDGPHEDALTTEAWGSPSQLPSPFCLLPCRLRWGDIGSSSRPVRLPTSATRRPLLIALPPHLEWPPLIRLRLRVRCRSDCWPAGLAPVPALCRCICGSSSGAAPL